MLFEIDSLNKRLTFLEDLINNADFVEKVTSRNKKINNIENEDFTKEPLQDKNNKALKPFICKDC